MIYIYIYIYALHSVTFGDFSSHAIKELGRVFGIVDKFLKINKKHVMVDIFKIIVQRIKNIKHKILLMVFSCSLHGVTYNNKKLTKLLFYVYSL